MAKVALAYSGSLDTTICVHWLREIRGMKVYTFSANLGQIEDLRPLADRAVDLGSTASHIADLRNVFIDEFVFPCVRANAEYETGYFLFSALSRPLIARELVKVAREEGCEYIAHGARGSGNDMIRFRNSLQALAPEIEVITPLQDLSVNTLKEAMRYARSHGLKVDHVKRAEANVEQNLWGSHIHVGNLKDTWKETPENLYVVTASPADAPPRPTSIDLKFAEGAPVALDGETLPRVELIDRLNKIGGRNGVGRYDVIENRLNGSKSRELYEAPAATVISAAHKALESAVLEKDLLHFKEPLSRKYAELIYEGKWYSPFRESLEGFFRAFQRDVNGTVRLRLYKGHVSVIGLKARATHGSV
ncbi:MAG: argininosuccinate synthase [Planctomycetes bacterium RBG_16_59_8]|nr:MAG: argininosuccinate synthase [Planctomycetes bacterium RBG_16_59_8]